MPAREIRTGSALSIRKDIPGHFLGRFWEELGSNAAQVP